MVRPVSMAVWVALIACLSASAGDADPITEKLDKAKAVYEAKVKAVREAVVNQLDAKEDQASKSGNKKRVDLVEAEREAFDKEGLYPTVLDPYLKRQAEEAHKTLVAAYTTAETEYTKAKMRAEAKIAAKERTDLEKAAAEVRLKEMFASGKVFAGMRNDTPLELRVAERAGGTFKGNIHANGKVHGVTGKIDGDKVSFISQKNAGDELQLTYTGTLKGAQVNFTFEGTGSKGDKREGKGTLAPKK